MHFSEEAHSDYLKIKTFRRLYALRKVLFFICYLLKKTGNLAVFVNVDSFCGR